MNGNSQQWPPELIILKNKFNDFKKNFKISSLGIIITLIVLALLLLPSLFFSIEPDQDGVVQRFGKYVRTVGPGLHLKAPLGIEKVTKIRTRAILKEEFGFVTKHAGIRTEYERRGQYHEDESLMLTGDLNVADVEWIVQYQINDPQAYLFNVRHVVTNIRALSESVMRVIVGDHNVTDVLTTSRQEIEDEARLQLQALLTEYKTGVDVVTVKLQNVLPPKEVEASFHEVNGAKQESDKLINEAWKGYNKIIPEARGKAQQTIALAEGYAIERINKAKGDATRFMELQKEYSKASAVTKKRLYLESLQNVLKKVDKVFVMDPNLKSVLPLFNIPNLPQTEKTNVQ